MNVFSRVIPSPEEALKNTKNKQFYMLLKQNKIANGVFVWFDS